MFRALLVGLLVLSLTGCQTAPKQFATIEVEKDVWTETARPQSHCEPDARVRFSYRIDLGR